MALQVVATVLCNLPLHSITAASTVVPKGIIGYSDYSFAMVMFECFKSNGIFVVVFKKKNLTFNHLSGVFICFLLCNGHF